MSLRLVGLARVLRCAIGDERDDRIDLGIDPFDLLQVGGHRLARAQFLAADERGHFYSAQEADVRTFGSEQRSSSGGRSRSAQNLAGFAARDRIGHAGF